MNVFPTFDNYLEQFDRFIDSIEEGGSLFWFEKDRHLEELTKLSSVAHSSYGAHAYIIQENKTFLSLDAEKVEVPVFGNHNMQNIAAALAVCRELDLSDELFYEAIPSFKGAARRQQLLAKDDKKKVYLDFAHAPSKVKATVDSFKETYEGQKIFAFLELHTFSSLNKDFLPQYRDSLSAADKALVFYNPAVVEHKKLPEIDKEYVKNCFGSTELEVINDRKILESKLGKLYEPGIYLFMSSGNFSGLDIQETADNIIAN